jgi:hypothetical protein
MMHGQKTIKESKMFMKGWVTVGRQVRSGLCFRIQVVKCGPHLEPVGRPAERELCCRNHVANTGLRKLILENGRQAG